MRREDKKKESLTAQPHFIVSADKPHTVAEHFFIFNFSLHPTSTFNNTPNPAMSVRQSTSQLVDNLPLRLRNFFAKYPPQYYSSAVAPRPQPKTDGEAAGEQTTQSTSTDTSSDNTTTPDLPTPETSTLPTPYTQDRTLKPPKPVDPLSLPSRSLLHTSRQYRNPFLPHKNFRTGKWFSPRYGLREQADLVKLAIRYNVEALLPPGKKSSEYKEVRRAERGLAIKGTGVGQKVKGHKWERTMEERLDERKKAVMEMPQMINLWKQVSLSFVCLRFWCSC